MVTARRNCAVMIEPRFGSWFCLVEVWGFRDFDSGTKVIQELISSRLSFLVLSNSLPSPSSTTSSIALLIPHGSILSIITTIMAPTASQKIPILARASVSDRAKKTLDLVCLFF